MQIKIVRSEGSLIDRATPSQTPLHRRRQEDRRALPETPPVSRAAPPPLRGSEAGPQTTAAFQQSTHSSCEAPPLLLSRASPALSQKGALKYATSPLPTLLRHFKKSAGGHTCKQAV